MYGLGFKRLLGSGGIVRSTRPLRTRFSTNASDAQPSASGAQPIQNFGRPRWKALLWPFVPIFGFGVLFATGIGAVGAYGAFRINRNRTRWFSDKFVLSPESLRMPYKSVTFETEDGVQLEAWYIEQTVRGRPSDRIVICNNPFNHDKSTLLAVARALWDSGHSVLLFDFRAFGPKPVSQETIGHLELRDGRAAIKWVRENKPAYAKIGVMGCSMGGAVALMIVEEDDKEVVGVATDCAFACLHDVVTHYIESSLPERLPGRKQISDLIVMALAMCNIFWYGYDVKHVGPEKSLDSLRVPLLIVHSEKDSIVPLEQAYRIFNGAATPTEHKRIFVVKDCEHIGSFFENEIVYSKRIVSFLDMCFETYNKREGETKHQKKLMTAPVTVAPALSSTAPTYHEEDKAPSLGEDEAVPLIEKNDDLTTKLGTF